MMPADPALVNQTNNEFKTLIIAEGETLSASTSLWSGGVSLLARLWTPRPALD